VKAWLSWLQVVALVANLAPVASLHAAELPDMGSPAQAIITLEDEYRIGRMIVRGLRDSDQILDDPEITEYIEALGHKLSSQAQEGHQNFDFFVVKDNEINAFALPGGFVGVNAGLLLETRNEGELASVLGHEIAHVSQRHIARSIAEQSRSGLVSTAAMLAAILLGAATGSGDMAMAGVMAAQGLAIQNQISFTRENETEADRVGLGFLANSGFDPNAMPAFFETLGRRAGASEGMIPEMLRTHPVSTTRIAETRSRAEQYSGPYNPDSLGYSLTRERMRVLSTPAGKTALDYYAATITNEADATPAQRYGRGLALMAAGRAEAAVPIFEALLQGDQTVIQYHTALGQAFQQAGNDKAALATLNRARDLFPRNVPVTVRYAESLMQQGDSRKAHQVLLDLFNAVPPTPEQARLIARAANAAGDVADSYYYMAEYHLMGGDLPLAINQLKMALDVPELTSVQRARFQARMEEVQSALPKRQRGRLSSSSGGPPRQERLAD
jgi:beta-barrel assembly-enhancing protease